MKIYKVMYKLFIVLFLNRAPSIYLHIKMYSEAKILHFYLPKEIANAAISCNNSFLKNAKVAERFIKTQVAHVTKGSFLMHHLLWHASTHTQNEPITEYTGNIT